jgi:hypothetical protein
MCVGVRFEIIQWSERPASDADRLSRERPRILHDFGAWHVGEWPRRAVSICNSNRKFVNPSMRGRRAGHASGPFHAMDGYLAKLVRKGFRVAICEQVEDQRRRRDSSNAKWFASFRPGRSSMGTSRRVGAGVPDAQGRFD